jgi:Fe2+ or Zn2+ uptake regulation protein
VSSATQDTTQHVRQLTMRLQEQGVRITRQRTAIVSALCSSPGALTHQAILEEAKERCPDLGLATVYRTVDLLEKCGCVRRVAEAEGRDSVAVALAAHGHHVLCTKCNRVAEFSTCELASTVAAAARETGFVITEHHLELLGLCRACAQADAELRGGGAECRL